MFSFFVICVISWVVTGFIISLSASQVFICLRTALPFTSKIEKMHPNECNYGSIRGRIFLAVLIHSAILIGVVFAILAIDMYEVYWGAGIGALFTLPSVIKSSGINYNNMSDYLRVYISRENGELCTEILEEISDGYYT